VVNTAELGAWPQASGFIVLEHQAVVVTQACIPSQLVGIIAKAVLPIPRLARLTPPRIGFKSLGDLLEAVGIVIGVLVAREKRLHIRDELPNEFSVGFLFAHVSTFLKEPAPGVEAG
jgi:hypothetical protein